MTGGAPGPAARLCRWAYGRTLAVLPRRMRQRSGPAMEAMAAERMERARREGGMVGLGACAVREVLDVVRVGLRMRWAEGRSRRDRERRMTGGWWLDLVVSVRALLRRPGYTAVAAVTLALGIGATGAMFSVVHGVLLRPLAYPDAHRLVMVFHTLPDLGWEMGPLSLPNARALEEGSRAFESFGAATGFPATLLDRAEPRRVSGWRVTGSYFRTLGVEPALGRTIHGPDDRPGAPPVVVLDHGLWTSAFGADPQVLGSSVRLDGGLFTVVGVMPPGFPSLGDRDDFWVALGPIEASIDPDSNLLVGVARLADGVDVSDARADTDRLLQAAAEDSRARDRRAHLVSRLDYTVGGVRHQLLLLLGAVALVLLVACANVAGLALARGAQRARELSVRTALGASRLRLIRLSATESGLVAALGGLLGIALAVGLTRAVVAWGPPDLPRRASLSVDGTSLLFLVGASALCSILFGVLPALHAARSEPAGRLRTAHRSVASHRVQAGLAATQIALASVLLVGASLLGRSLLALQSVEPGFAADGALTAHLPLPAGSPDEVLAFVNDLEARVAAHPGVEAFGMAWSLPFASGEASTRATREDRPLAPDQRLQVYVTPVTSGFLQAMGMPLVEGPGFPESVDPDGPAMAVINRALADALWPEGDAVGRRFLRGGGEDATPTLVVGVVPTARTTSLAEADRPYAYLPFAQAAWAERVYAVVRTEGDPLTLVPHLRAAVADLDPALPVDRIATLDERVSRSLAVPRFRVALVGGFALVGALLALVGVYGAMALLVATRTRDIGVRMALGAARARVRRQVMLHGLQVAGAGLALGLGTAALLVRWVEAYLFGVPPSDPVTWIAVIVAVLGAVVLAVAPPARRASAVDPLLALRAE